MKIILPAVKVLELLGAYLPEGCRLVWGLEEEQEQDCLVSNRS